MADATQLVASLSRNPLPAAKHESIVTTIGSTPVVKLQRMAPPGVEVFVKLESSNPGGSVKDRLALGLIEWAEQNGKLSPGQTVVEASSGNTGIGLAMVCASKGYPFVCVMAESFSIERRKLMRFLGAKVVLTNPAHKGTGMVIKAKELADKHGWYLTGQFDNEANAWVHSQTTGPEILQAMGPAGIDHWFSAYGTGGTLKGVSRVLRQQSPATKVHACEPDNAPLLYSSIETEYPPVGQGSFVSPHPVWRPHLLQGWAPDFIPRLVGDAVSAGYIDQVHHIGGDAAMEVTRRLAREEGIFSGTSGGATLACALEFAKTEAAQGSTILVMIPDTGERYLSTPLFADVPADMTEEEKEIQQSTPSTAPPAIKLPPVNAAATAFVRQKNQASPVVVWSLEYCEFCWTIFGLFDALEVPYVKINIDSFEFAKDNLGNQYRAALVDITEVNTFPQCFIGGEFLGGAVDACLKWKDSSLKPILEKAGVAYSDKYAGDAFEFLPKWMSQNPLRSK